MKTKEVQIPYESKPWWHEVSVTEYNWPQTRLLCFAREGNDVFVWAKGRKTHDILSEGDSVLLPTYDGIEQNELDDFKEQFKQYHIHLVKINNTNQVSLFAAKNKLPVMRKFYNADFDDVVNDMELRSIIDDMCLRFPYAYILEALMSHTKERIANPDLSDSVKSLLKSRRDDLFDIMAKDVQRQLAECANNLNLKDLK